jgi:pathogenesis-related protein 1
MARAPQFTLTASGKGVVMRRSKVVSMARALGVFSDGLLGLLVLSVIACSGDDSSNGSGSVSSKVSESDQQTCVDAINAVRASVRQPANYAGNWSTLPDVTWSDTAAASAQGWANHLASLGCKLEHASNTGYGENLARGTHLTVSSAVAMWASEIDAYNWSPTYTAADFNAGSGHYTQLVWRSTVEVGCGTAECGTSVVVSCRFSPPGNYLGRSVY